MEAGGSCGFAADCVPSPHLFSNGSPLIRDPLCGAADENAMMQCLHLLILTALAVVVSACAKSFPDRRPLGIALGTSGYVRLSRTPTGDAFVEHQSESPLPAPYVRFRFTDNPTFRLLITENEYPYDLDFDIKVCVTETQACSLANINPVKAHGSNGDAWPEPIDAVILSNFRLINPD